MIPRTVLIACVIPRVIPCALWCGFAVGCAAPQPGPDKQFVGAVGGAATGAGAGAVTGFQLGAGTGPGAAVGAGVGAVVGGIQGIVQDMQEQDMLRLAAESRREREKAYVHEILAEHYKRRIELHPTRDIYPADIFFRGDESTLTPAGTAIVLEIARLNKRRLPGQGSRLQPMLRRPSLNPSTGSVYASSARGPSAIRW